MTSDRAPVNGPSLRGPDGSGHTAWDGRVALYWGVTLPLLHGAAGFWDDLIGFLGILAVIGGLLFLTWRSGKKKQRQRRRSRGSRS